MATLLKPRDEAEVARVVSWAAAERKPLEVVGGGSKRSVGRPFQAEYTLNMGDVAGVTLYEPEELVLRAGAGTPIDEISELLASKGQALPFEPPDFADFLGTAKGPTTLGGALASNLSGPRRIKAGAARDHVLGLRAVTGRAETVNLGGRVMKNVTGYDLCRGLAGSWGTLAVMTEVTVKVLPAAETEATLVLAGLTLDAAIVAMSVALGSTTEVSGACHIPAKLAARSRVAAVASAGTGVTALRLEGFAPSVAARRKTLIGELKAHGAIEDLSREESAELWGEIRDVALLQKADDRVVWRVSTAPTRAPDLIRSLSGEADIEALYDWGGGLVWLQLPGAGDGGAGAIRTTTAEVGGHATLVSAPPATRSAVNVFEPQPEALAALTRRIKAAFDPHGILNPGRMYAGV